MPGQSRRPQLVKAAQRYLAKKSPRDLFRILRQRAVAREKRRGRLLRVSKWWEKWEIELLGKHSDEEVARQTGRLVSAVNKKRRKLRILMHNGPVKRWNDWDRNLLGKCPDKEVAGRTGRTVEAVRCMRLLLGIERFGGLGLIKWRRRELKLLGKYPDAEVARRIGRTVLAV